MKNLTYWALIAICGIVGFQGCGSSGGKAPVALTPRCILPSDCSGHLVCIDRYCVNECAESKDCTGGARCIAVEGGGNSCQPPEKKLCTLNSDCSAGLVCGVDQQCRNQCHTDVDCPKNQRCTASSLLCADPKTDTNYDPTTNEFKPTAGGTGGTVADGGGTGGTPVDGSSSDGPAPTEGGGTDAGPGIDAMGTVLDGVTVAPSKSVRPGQGNIIITITQTAGGLSNPTTFDLGGLTVHADAGGTDTTLVLRVAVPHGAALGTRTLKVAAAGGIFMAADVVEVTAITVGPSGVDSNPGSAAAPFKTLKTAILTAGGGDTIHLLDGTYNAASGETWGYVIPDNLTIVGDSTEATILDGAGAASNLNGFDASAALTLKSLTVQHFTIGIDVKKPSSMLTLQDVVLASHSYYGISVESTAMGSTVTMSGAKGLITQPGHQAIYVASVPNTTINLTDGKLQGGSYVIQISGNCSGSKLNVSGTTIEQLTPNAYSAIYTSISSNPAGTEFTFDKTTFIGSIDYDDPKGSVTITGSMIQPKAGYGVNFAGKTLSITGTTISMMMNNYPGIYYHSAMLGTMSLKNVTVDGGNYNIQQNAPGSTSKMRGTTLKNSQSDGYYLQAGDLDLGTAAESGDNIFGSPVAAGGYCLYISRGGGMNGGGPVTCSGTAFGATGPNDGQRPSAADSVDASGGAVTKAPQLYYVGAGDKLTFF